MVLVVLWCNALNRFLCVLSELIAEQLYLSGACVTVHDAVEC